MVELIIQMLDLQEWKGISKNIDFAKGSHKLPTNIKEGWKQYKREKAWQRK